MRFAIVAVGLPVAAANRCAQVRASLRCCNAHALFLFRRAVISARIRRREIAITVRAAIVRNATSRVIGEWGAGVRIVRSRARRRRRGDRCSCENSEQRKHRELWKHPRDSIFHAKLLRIKLAARRYYVRLQYRRGNDSAYFLGAFFCARPFRSTASVSVSEAHSDSAIASFCESP